MARFALRRLLGMLLVLFAASVVVFAIFNVIPNTNPAEAIAGKNATPQLVAQVEETWGFDRPLPSQYLSMMELILGGDLVSYSSQLNVVDEIWQRAPVTFSLAIGAAIVWMAFGVLFGYLSAVREGGALDRALTVLTLVGLSLPVFWLAAIFLYYLTFQVQLFPSTGYVPLTENPLDWAYHLVLPWTTLAVLYVGFYSRVLRSNMLEAMGEDYVRTARAKGLGERRVMTHHVLRNSLIPVVSLFGLDFGAVLGGGAILVEVIFGLNGIGQYAAEAIGNLDLPPLMAVTLFGAFFVVLLNALVDIAYAYLDPRVRRGEGAP